MSELKVIDVDKMADVRSLSGQFYRKSEADEVISTIKAERDEYRYNLSCARNEIHSMQIAAREDVKTIAEKDREIEELKNSIAPIRTDKTLQERLNEVCQKHGVSTLQDLDCAFCESEKSYTKDRIEVANRICHHKHKRCLAMAEMCDEVMMSCELRGYTVLRIWANKHEWAMRWKYRWLELSEKFKEEK